MVVRAGVEAKFKFGVHPYMLRHACGYALANRGHDTRALQAYLRHKNIQHTVRYCPRDGLKISGGNNGAKRRVWHQGPRHSVEAFDFSPSESLAALRRE
jgi:hypothetical protein